MNVAIVHHAEKKKEKNDPGLTAFGTKQATRAAHFVAQNMTADFIWHTQTQRTQQSANRLMKQFPLSKCSFRDDIPDRWEEWCSFGENLYKEMPNANHCIVCHHTTIQMCKQQFQIPLFLSCFSSVVLLERIALHTWNCTRFRQGEISL